MTHKTILNPAVINFHGQEIITIEKDGKRYVAMKPICEGMGLNWRAQRELIERDPVLDSTRRVIRLVAQDGKNREMICLPLEYLNGWLFKIDAGRYAKKDRRRKIIIRYQKECYQVLYDYWHGHKAEKPLDPDEQMNRRIAKSSIQVVMDMPETRPYVIDAFCELTPAHVVIKKDEYIHILKTNNDFLNRQIEILSHRKKPISNKEKQKMKRMHKQGMGPLEIADKLNRNFHTVRNIIYSKGGSNQQQAALC